jgi:hypothetical protein
LVGGGSRPFYVQIADGFEIGDQFVVTVQAGSELGTGPITLGISSLTTPWIGQATQDQGACALQDGRLSRTAFAFSPGTYTINVTMMSFAPGSVSGYAYIRAVYDSEYGPAPIPVTPS